MAHITAVSYKHGALDWVEIDPGMPFELPIGESVEWRANSIQEHHFIDDQLRLDGPMGYGRWNLTIIFPDGATIIPEVLLGQDKWGYQWEGIFSPVVLEQVGPYTGIAEFWLKAYGTEEYVKDDEMSFSFVVPGAAPPAPPAGKWYWGAAVVALVVGGIVLAKRKKRG